MGTPVAFFFWGRIKQGSHMYIYMVILRDFHYKNEWSIFLWGLDLTPPIGENFPPPVGTTFILRKSGPTKRHGQPSSTGGFPEPGRCASCSNSPRNSIAVAWRVAAVYHRAWQGNWHRRWVMGDWAPRSLVSNIYKKRHQQFAQILLVHRVSNMLRT